MGMMVRNRARVASPFVAAAGSAADARGGFTLLELMLALAVLAIVAVAVLGRGADTVRQLHGLEQRTLAHWVAENELARLRLAQRRAARELRAAAAEDSAPGDESAAGGAPSLAVGTRRSEQRLGNRAWRIVVETARTDHPTLRRVAARVYAADEAADPAPAAILIGFLGPS